MKNHFTHAHGKGHSFGRRDCLRLLGAGAGAALGGAAALPWLSTQATAATDDYKALVCIFLYGGNDGANTIVPRDVTRHAEYARIRGQVALPRESLIALNNDYGLHPAMPALSTAWADGALAPVFNVGPLFAPLDKAAYRSASPTDDLIPDNLFSHSDQQVLWETSATDVLERAGWGGRAAQTLGTTNPVISFGGSGRFGMSLQGAPWTLPGPGEPFEAQGFNDWAPVAARKQALEALHRETQETPLLEAYARGRREAFELPQRLKGLFDFNPDPAADASGIVRAFESLIVNGKLQGTLVKQLYQVARFVNSRAQVGGTRQIFFVQLGGFDNHAGQIDTSSTDGVHSALLGQLARSMGAFWQAMKNIGMTDRVTAFTQSDFGRTLTPNDTRGTDHAWGNHHLVLGGAVAGGQTHGRYPTLAIGGPDDVGVDTWEQQGRMIPGISVDQYSATLLRWFGASETQLDSVLPHLQNFGSARSAGFMRV
jgi:uncharacterized protein (DUF1501 family)